jgi:hypothetical protein
MTPRLVSVFEDRDESVLLDQCAADFTHWGFAPAQSRQMADRVLDRARAELAADSKLKQASNLEPATGSGVTPDDARWYWGLPPIARAVMLHFDEVLRSEMWLECHRVNICIEDLELDLRRRLPTFGTGAGPQAKDAPLPWELRRRFAEFISKIRRDERAWHGWSTRCQRVSSMNALVREEVHAGNL